MANALQTALAGLSNVNTPNFGSANQLNVAAGQQITQGLDTLRGLAQERNEINETNYQTGVDRNTQQALNALNQEARRVASAGGTPADIDVQSILGQYGNQIDLEKFNQGANQVPQNIGAEIQLQKEIDTTVATKASDAAINSVFETIPLQNGIGEVKAGENYSKRVKAINENPNLSSEAKRLSLTQLADSFKAESLGVQKWSEPESLRTGEKSFSVYQTDQDGNTRILETGGAVAPNIEPSFDGGFESATTEKRFYEIKDSNTAALGRGNQIFNLYNQTQDVALPAGWVGKTSEVLANITGSQDEASALRKEWAAITNAKVLSSLPPGPASDKDITFASKGVPTEFTNKAQMQQYLVGLGKINALESARTAWEAEYLSKNGSARGMSGAWSDEKESILDGAMTNFNNRYVPQTTDTPTNTGSGTGTPATPSVAGGGAGSANYSNLW